MDDSTRRSRRRILGAVGIGGSVLLAGCSEQLGLGDESQETPDETSGESQDGPDETSGGRVAAIAAVDQGGLQEEQAALQEDIRSGNMSQEEAQAEMAEIREQYLTEAMDSLVSTLEEAEGVDVDEEYESAGAVIVTGDADAILGVLASDNVSGFVAAADVEEQLSAQEAED